MHLGKIKPQSFFLFVSIFWGLINIILTPPFQVPDEPAHYFKSLQIAHGDFFPDSSNNMVGGYFPKNALNLPLALVEMFEKNQTRVNFQDLGETLKIRMDKSSRAFVLFPNTARIFPVPYLPQAFGIIIGKQFFESPLLWFYFARLFNLIFWITIILFAVKLMPLHKWTMIILALLPMNINLAASLSADAFTIAISFLFIAILLRLAFSEEYIRWKSVIWMLLVLMLVALSKNVYIILGLLFFVIPKAKFRERGFYFTTLLLTAIVGIIGFATGSIYTAKVYDLVEPGVSFFHHFAESNSPVDHHKQIDFIFADPVEYVIILISSMHQQWLGLVFSGIGVLGWINIFLPFWYYIFMVIMVLFMALFEGSKNVVINLQNKFTILLVIAMTIVLIYTISYLTWTPVGQNTIDGMQGRYFLPVVPLIFLLFYNRLLKIPPQIIGITAMIMVFVSIVVSALALYEKYWNFL